MTDSRKHTRRAVSRPQSHAASRLRPEGAAKAKLSVKKPQPTRTRAQSTPVPQKSAVHPTERKSGAERSQKSVYARRAIVAGIVVAGLALAGIMALLILSYTPAFTIEQVDAPETEHMTSDQIVQLANVEKGATLLGVDEKAVTANLHKNPWVGTVSFEREFPSTLKINVTERTVDTVAVISSGNVAWAISSDDVWIEPVLLSVKDGQSRYGVALAKAQELGALLVSDLPSSVSPVAGATVTDDTLDAVAAYRERFSANFSSQIVAFSAPNVEGITCMLASGVEISLGTPTDIESKEQVAEGILSEHEGKVTYINVRSYSKPSYRIVDSDNVGQGSGAVASTSS